jgi:SAM-dependent methyltransferase
MEKMRKPFQGVGNIIRFNWHFYVLSVGFVVAAIFISNYFAQPFQFYVIVLCLLTLGSTIISLLVSFYVYDFSGLYKLDWVNDLMVAKSSRVVNIHAGFDETSQLLKDKFKLSDISVFDFYDPLKHTEVSIKRARKAYPPFPNTKSISTAHVPLDSSSMDFAFVIFSAHEIRNESERKEFFGELRRVIKPSGQVVVAEHLRDTANFLAFNIGFLHFYSRPTWYDTFQSAQFDIQQEIKLNPFVSTFFLRPNGSTR